MGNIVDIYGIKNKKTELLGYLNLPMSCMAISIKTIYKKYLNESELDKVYSFKEVEMSEILNKVWDKSTDTEKPVLGLFIIDVYQYEKKDIKNFDKFINDYPSDLNNNPKKVLINFRDFIKDKFNDYEKIETRFGRVTFSTTVIETKEQP